MQWINKTEIKSASSDRLYIVSQHSVERFWACSCPAWKTRRKCKHLQQLGLPGGQEPFEMNAGKKNRLLEGYKKYDTSDGHGSADDWRKALFRILGINEERLGSGLDDLILSYERAVRDFDGHDDPEAEMETVRLAKFRLEACVTYLTEQAERLQAAQQRVTQSLRDKITAT